MKWCMLLALASASFGGLDAVHAATIKVPQDHATINAAVAASSPGDVIEIAKGTYPENVVVDKPSLTLLGKGKVVIDPGGAGARIRVSSVSDVVVRKLHVRNTGLDGIVLDLAAFCRVEDCRVTDAATNGIRVDDSTGNEILGCRIEGTTVGIVVSGDTNRVAECRVRDASIGVSVSGDDNVVERTTVEDTLGAGVDVSGITNVIDGCTVRGSGGDGIQVMGSGNAVVDCSAVDGADEGIDVQSDGVFVFGCVASKTLGHGIEVSGTGILVESCRASNAQLSGIMVFTGGKNVVRGCSVRKSQEHGIRLLSNENLLVSCKVRQSGLLDLSDEGIDNVFIANDVQSSNFQ